MSVDKLTPHKNDIIQNDSEQNGSTQNDSRHNDSRQKHCRQNDLLPKNLRKCLILLFKASNCDF